MTVDWPVFIGEAVLTALITLSLQVFVERLKHRNELERAHIQEQLARERVQWDELRVRVNPLLKTAGALVTHVGGWAIDHRAEEIRSLLRELNTYPPQFTDYPDVRTAIWAFQNTVNIILDNQWFFLSDEQREARAELATLEPPETPEEREKRQREEFESSKRLRDVQLPQTYQALVIAAKRLLEPPPASIPSWRRFLIRIRQVRVGRFGERDQQGRRGQQRPGEGESSVL